jgi:hypothetical protein
LRPDRAQDHRRYLWRRGPAWRRRVLRQGPDQGRPFGRLCRALSRQEHRRRDLAGRCTLQLAYAIGVARPLSIYIDTHGTGKVPEEKLEKAVAEAMDLTPRGIRKHLDLNKPIYARTSSYGHFGRTPDNEGGFSWEKTDLADALKRAV